jgi:hypothetical protein
MPGSADFSALSYTLTFTPVSGSTPVTATATVSETAVDLEPGTWNLSVTGSKGETTVLEGSASGIVVQSGGTTPVSVAMKAKTAGGNGTLHYSLNFPETVTRGWLRVYGGEDGNLTQTVDLLEDPTSKSGDLTISGGYYRLKVELYTADGVLNRSDIAHIYPGQTTAADYAFASANFVAANVIDTETSLADVLSGISGLSDGANMVYFLEAGDEFMAPVNVSHTGGAVTVTIDGGGRTVTLSENDALITIGSGSGVTLKLKNITLRGRGTTVDNYAALIEVYGGTLELNDGVVITGNRTSLYGGGGVYVADNGTFIMNGGEISDNTASSSGGGVYVLGGTLTIN